MPGIGGGFSAAAFCSMGNRQTFCRNFICIGVRIGCRYVEFAPIGIGLVEGGIFAGSRLIRVGGAGRLAVGATASRRG